MYSTNLSIVESSRDSPFEIVHSRRGGLVEIGRRKTRHREIQLSVSVFRIEVNVAATSPGRVATEM